MLFNSYQFLFIFLPFLILLFFSFAKIFTRNFYLNILLIASLIFYGINNLNFLIIFLLSIFINYICSKCIEKETKSKKINKAKIYLYFGITINLILLFIYKYYNFVANNLQLININIQELNLLLPIGISFYTFQQIGFLTDTYKGKITKLNIFEYSLFVSFFPQLIAGPIVKFNEFITQIKSDSYNPFNYTNISNGIIIFIFALFKKIVIADTLSRNVDPFYNAISSGLETSIPVAWLGTIAYSLQIYFDFSAYSEMAIGLGLIFGIKLPINFDSPYQSSSLIEYWNKWNITLSNFFRDNLYTPIFLNLSKKTSLSFANHIYSVFITMTLLGLWHGASWNCIVFGLLHGFGLVLNNIFKKRKITSVMPNLLNKILLLIFLNTAFVFFRASNLKVSTAVINALFPLDKITKISTWNSLIVSDDYTYTLSKIILILFLFIVVIYLPSTLKILGYVYPLKDNKKMISVIKKYNLNIYGTLIFSTFAALIFAVSIAYLYDEQSFIYFQF